MIRFVLNQATQFNLKHKLTNVHTTEVNVREKRKRKKDKKKKKYLYCNWLATVRRLIYLHASFDIFNYIHAKLKYINRFYPPAKYRLKESIKVKDKYKKSNEKKNTLQIIILFTYSKVRMIACNV